MPAICEAYLDIETTGLSPFDCELTVIGVHTCNGEKTEFRQLVGGEITAASLLEILEGVEVIYTYNGSRFDLPFIEQALGVDLLLHFQHRDLMYDCWQNNLYGGFKGVEKQLGIFRKLAEMNGLEAVKLWWRYADYFDLEALAKLLDYNREDVLNLKVLKERLL